METVGVYDGRAPNGKRLPKRRVQRNEFSLGDKLPLSRRSIKYNQGLSLNHISDQSAFNFSFKQICYQIVSKEFD